MTDKTKILFLAGWGRSGSTLIARALGGIDGWSTVGEVRRAWDFGVLRNEPCGCSAPFHDCPFWTDVFKQAFGGMDRKLAERMVSAQDRIHTWQMALMPSGMLRRRAGDWDGEFLQTLGRLYRAIAEVSGSRVIVDSSKIPTYAYALRLMPDGDLFVAHLVRDPRACTYSWSKRRKAQPFGLMKSVGPIGNSLQWANRNQAVRAVWDADPAHYRLMRYEDFIAQPHAVLSDMANFVREPDADLSHVSGSSVTLVQTHMAAGNPNRFNLGAVDLRLDNEWESALPNRDKALVKLLARPQMRRYGYA